METILTVWLTFVTLWVLCECRVLTLVAVLTEIVVREVGITLTECAWKTVKLLKNK